MRGKTVLIVGGGGGIGSECAYLFAKSNANVVIAGRDQAKLNQVATGIKDQGGEVTAQTVDVTDVNSVTQLVEHTVSTYGPIDVLVNAFGQGLIMPIKDIDPEQAKEVIDVNVFGTFIVTQTVLKYLSQGDEPASVIMFPGTMGKYIMKNASVYSATKFAIQGFTKTLTEELKRDNVNFSLLYLGGVATPFWDDERVTMRVKKDYMLDPKEVAKAVYYAAKQPKGSVMNEVVIQPESHQLV
ncbi:MAG: SDR family oxidoreductase [Bacteroidota bacterium]